MALSIQFNWSQARAFVQDGTIFYSPNSTHMVIIPTQASTNSPFEKRQFGADDFKQPVWWTDVYGWQSFIPLAPSFTSTPFEPFCWMPRIVEVNVLVDPMSGSDKREKRYEMHPDDCCAWTKRERLLTEAAELIRVWFKIPGNLPPPPSKFNYRQAHKSLRIAKKMITLARDWFSVWMGFISYLIACTKRFYPSASSEYTRPESDSPFPVWYHRLQEVHNYPAAWLDGLTSSTVCSYDTKTLRAGVVFEWSKNDRTRPPIEWFLEHQIPMWFVWSREEEQAISRDRSLAFLKPPDNLIKDAITRLFENPTTRIPLAGLIIQRYYSLGSDPITNETVKLLKFREAPSFVLQYTTKLFLAQESMLAKVDAHTDEALRSVMQAKKSEQMATSHKEATIPTQTMIEGVKAKGRLFNHWQDFLDNRERRQQEIIKVESNKDRQRRLAREQNPGVKNADLYTWERIRSSGGKEVYMRLRVSKKWNEQVFSSYKIHQRVFNAITNEWDLCREMGTKLIENGHQPNETSSESDDSDDDESFDWEQTQYAEDGPLETSPYPRPQTPPPGSQGSVPVQTNSTDKMDIVEDEEIVFRNYSQDVIASLNLGYGYVPLIPSSPSSQQLPIKEWESQLVLFGFISPFPDLDIDQDERQAISTFLDSLLKNCPLPASSDDLNSDNHAALCHLFDFQAIHHPSSEMFVFSSPRSMASNWLLGIDSPQVALYVIRYILSNPGAHTIVTVASRLLERGIPFRTLLGLDCSSRQTTILEPYNPPAYRLASHIFTLQDFDSYLLRCQTILSQPQGRAALLKGGIIWRIAKQFLSWDDVLTGPSVEVSTHRLGYFHTSGTAGIQYCDDELTENEIALICGTYSLYTAFGQVTMKSWFPPPICWTKDRTGCNWVEWTPHNEKFFGDLLRDIYAGKHMPLTVTEWMTRLRGFKKARVLRENNHKRASVFMDNLVPAPKTSD